MNDDYWNQYRCKICNKTRDLFPLELQTDDDVKYTVFICGSCWDIIFAIAKMAHKLNREDVRNGTR